MHVLQVTIEPRFADMPPARIVPMLADEGVYNSQGIDLLGRTARGWADDAPWSCARAFGYRQLPTQIVAALRQVRCWRMMFLPARVTGRS